MGLNRKKLIYDIESFDDAFSIAVYSATDNAVDIYVDADPTLIDAPNFQQRLINAVHAANPSNFADGIVTLFDLRSMESYQRLASLFGTVPVTPRHPESPLAPPVKTDVTAPGAPYLMGYNSMNYDTSMVAWYFHICVQDSPCGEQIRLTKVTPAGHYAALRQISDTMFTTPFKCCMADIVKATFEPDGSLKGGPDRPILSWDTHPSKIRMAWMSSGLHVDVARLNEKQQRVGLKRLCGMLGLQILESEKLSSGQSHLGSTEALIDMLAYNVSDVVNTWELFTDNLYTAAFELRQTMLETYPELIFETDEEGKPTTKVRRNRLRPDSTSQQFASRSLCPDGHIPDARAISVVYPSEKQAAKTGRLRVDVLDDTRNFLAQTLAGASNLEGKHEALDAFDQVYAMYNDLRGKNVNGSDAYDQDWGADGLPFTDIGNRHLFPVRPTTLCYYDKDGNRTSCYVNFSTGGIHGAEYNKALYEYDLAKYEQKKFLFDRARWFAAHLAPLDETDMGTDDDLALRLHRSVPKLSEPIPFDFGDGQDHFVKEFLTSKSTAKQAQFKTFAKPELFAESKKVPGKTSLDARYAFTSVCVANHEDFSSYYPNLLRQMSAFENPHLGYDRYGEQYELKEIYGKQRKDPAKSPEERQIISNKREGTKLILNSASGAGDAGFDNPIRMNNNINAMRMIGQLFAYRIGQAQAAEGARIVSTNTDGLYSVMEEKRNNELLEKAAASTGVLIEPEVVHLITKDANNRIEYKVNDDGSFKILDAGGASLSCYKGPSPAQSLAHPAFFDRLLAYYMMSLAEDKGQAGFFEPFDYDRATTVVTDIVKSYETDPLSLLLLLQNVIASSDASASYIVAHDSDPNEADPATLGLQHYNRVFMVKPDTPGAKFICRAVGRTVTPATKAKRTRDHEKAFQHNDVAKVILQNHGWGKIELEAEGREAVFAAFPQLPETQPMLVVNQSIKGMTPGQMTALIKCVDLDAYIAKVADIYENTWRNAAVPEE